MFRELLRKAFGSRAKRGEERAPSDPREAVIGLRRMALEVTRADAGIPATKGAWGVVMDTTNDEGNWFTITAFADGTASLYLSTGGGRIGGGRYETVKLAAMTCVAQANEHLEELETSAIHAPPALKHTRIYVKTDEGLLASPEILEEDLGYNRHGLSRLFHCMHKLIAMIHASQEQTD